MLLRILCTLTFVAAVVSVNPAAAQEWTRFRGPNGSGVSSASGLPVHWTDAHRRWRTELPGSGHGSPVVWGDRLFVTTAPEDGTARGIACLATRTGEVLWSREYAGTAAKQHKRNSYASSTPAVDAQHVYVAYAADGRLLVCALTHSGEEAWARDLGEFRASHGFANSPIVVGDQVIMAIEQDGPASIAALACETGEIRWQVPRTPERAMYSTPCVFTPEDGPPQLILTSWKTGISGFDPDTGDLLWEISVFDQDQVERAIGSPVIAGDLVIGTCGFVTSKKHVVAVRPRRVGDGYEVEEVWRIERAVPHIPTALAHAGRVWLWNDQGIVTCVEAATGKVIWTQRLGGNFFGSPVYVGGHLYCINDAGDVIVLGTGDRFEEVARNPLGEPCQSTPAIAGGLLLIRTQSAVVAIGEPGPAADSAADR